METHSVTVAPRLRISTPPRHSTSVTYLITFSCYGAHLHGDERGSVDPDHNQLGSPMLPAKDGLLRYEQDHMTQLPYLLDEPRRSIVLSAIESTCRYRGWQLHAAHVRQNHIHVVVSCECAPEKTALAFKAYASRSLNQASLDSPDRKRWTRHFSIRLIGDLAARERAIRYVATKQGEPMTLFVADERAP